MAQRTQLNPWTWQDPLGFSQAWRLDEARRLLFVSGQGPIDETGQLVGDGDFAAQAARTFDNIDTVLAAGGMTFADVVKLTVFLTDIANLRDFGRIKGQRYPGPQPASTAVQVVALAIPGMALEVEAIAAADHPPS